MAKSFELEAARSPAGPGSSERAPTWPRWLHCGEPAALLVDLGRDFGPGLLELSLVSMDPAEGCLAEWRGNEAAAGGARGCDVVVRGAPDWRLKALVDKRTAGAESLLERAAVALEAWRHARVAVTEAERRLAARTAELDLLQALGRSAAEAQNPHELFAAIASVLERGTGPDLLMASYPWEGLSTTEAFVARPFASEYLDAVAERASRFLGAAAPRGRPLRLYETNAYDEARGPRQDFHEEDLLMLPLLRRGEPFAALLVVPSREVDEGALRLLFGGANQIALQLDRILTLHEAEVDRFRSIVESLPQGVLVVDTASQAIQANRSAQRMLDKAGLELSNGLPDVLARLGLSELLEAVRDGSRPVAEGQARIGTDQFWSVTLSPLCGARGRMEGLVLVLSDVTESRRLQLQLAQSEKMSSLGQLISGVAHELNNPLASILGYAQLIAAGGVDDKLVQRMDVLRREAERCRRIVQNLLSFARGRDPVRQPLSLNQVVLNVLSLLDYQLRVDGILVETELSAELPPMLGDAHQLEQVLVNLLTNARHAIRQQGPTGSVHVRTACEGEASLTLDVRDSGPGIPDTLRARIFDPFVTTKAPGKGTGLGLSLAYGIVTAHSGTIEALPTEGRGAWFRLRFPAGRLRDLPAEPSSPPSSRPQPRRGRILVVDDEEVLGGLICEALEADGHHAERASDGRQALERVASAQFDLIISDLRMPVMDAERFHVELGQTHPDLLRRLLLTTGDTVSREPCEFISRTGLDVLHKPFDLDELLRVVRIKLASG